MPLGQVTALSLNLRDAPDGNVVSVLRKGTQVTVLDTTNGWCRVSTTVPAPLTGFASAQFIAVNAAAGGTPAAAPPTLPIADDAAHPVTVAGNKAIGPDGQTSFASVYKSGFYTLGVTSLSSWLAGGGSAGAIPSSVVDTVRAVSLNEGRLEAVNSWDNAHMSFGVFQWTAGAGTAAGELAGLLAQIQRASPAAFAACFGNYGLGARMASATAATGVLTLNGADLNTSALKDQLRTATWAYRFWRAGHFPEVRQAELALAAARIATFRGLNVRGFTVGQWLTSQYGIALVLDEHVNRPGHVPGTLGAALARLPAGVPASPAAWTTAHEATLIGLYCEERENTNMTDPAARATRIADCVHAGNLSDQRGSF